MKHTLTVLNEIAVARTSSHPLMVGCYVAIRGEADVGHAVPQLRERGCRTAFPVVDRASQYLQFVEVDDETPWAEGAYNIPEPTAGAPVSPVDFDVLLIPGVAFDLRGYRIGYGGGYYDKLLANPSIRARRIGILYQQQLVDDACPEVHDQPMDMLLTEHGRIVCERGGGGG